MVSKCLTLPEKSGDPKVSEKISMEPRERNNFLTLKNDDVHILILPEKVVNLQYFDSL